MKKTDKENEKGGRVVIRLPRLRDGKDEDALVGLNGVMYRIKRGVEVSVPADCIICTIRTRITTAKIITRCLYL